MTETVATATVAFERRDHVAVIGLRRPEARNAVNAEMAQGLAACLDELAADPSLRVGVLTATGPVFCAGADLKALAAGQPVDVPGREHLGFAGMTHHPVDKPLIAAVEGVAFGGGTELVLACDLVVAAETARFGLPEVTRGLIAGAGGVVRLPQQIPVRFAMEVALTGEPFTAATALSWGLVNRVVATGTALAEAMVLAERIATNAPLSVRSSKRMVRLAAYGSDDLWERNARECAALLASADAREGMRAFTEKRPPRWSGR